MIDGSKRKFMQVKDVRSFLDSVLAEDIHTKRVESLANATLGVMTGLKDPLIYYFAMLGKHFGMKQVRIWLTFTLVKPPDLMGGVCASPCNLIVRDRLTY